MFTFQIGQCTECIKDCNDSLVYNPRFFKSILRRAIAYENIENYKKAYEDYRLTIVMDPSQVNNLKFMIFTGSVIELYNALSIATKPPHSRSPI